MFQIHDAGNGLVVVPAHQQRVLAAHQVNDRVRISAVADHVAQVHRPVVLGDGIQAGV